jgi:hypothetical protein
MNLTPFEVGFGAAWAIDAHKKNQRNAIFQQAEAARLWHAQTGQMTDAGYQAIVQANYLRATTPKPMGNVGMFFSFLFFAPLILIGLAMVAVFLWLCLAGIVEAIF